jgi:hypothetical protein
MGVVYKFITFEIIIYYEGESEWKQRVRVENSKKQQKLYIMKQSSELNFSTVLKNKSWELCF